MSVYIKLSKAGLSVHWDIDNPHAKTDCGCKICCAYRPVFNRHELAYQEMVQEAKNRKCKRKSCKRHGCDCF